MSAKRDYYAHMSREQILAHLLRTNDRLSDATRQRKRLRLFLQRLRKLIDFALSVY